MINHLKKKKKKRFLSELKKANLEKDLQEVLQQSHSEVASPLSSLKA